MKTISTVRNVASVVWSTTRLQAVVLLFLTTVSVLLLPFSIWLSGRAVNLVAEAAGHHVADSRWMPWAVTLGLVFAAQRVLTVINLGYQRRFAERIGVRVQRMFLEAASRADLAALESAGWRDRMTRAARSLGGRPGMLVQSFFQVYGSVISSVGLLTVLFTLSPILLPLTAILVASSVPQQRIRSKAVHELYQRFTTNERERLYFQFLLTESKTSRELRAFALGPHLLGRYDRAAASWLAEFSDAMRRSDRLAWLSAAVTAVLAVAAYLYTLGQGVHGAITPGGVTVAIGTFTGLTSQLSNIAASVSNVQESAQFLDDFFDFLAITPRVSAPDTPASLLTASTDIEFEDVFFTYPGASQPALAALNLSVKSGELLAIVGANGSGKTTLVKLLLRLYDPDRGTVRIGGVDLKDTDPLEVREQIGALFQDFITFDFTVRENVGFGRLTREPSDTAVRSSLERGQAWPAVSRLRHGIDSHLGHIREDGQAMSGGELQRLALARLFFRDARVWVLDEPTSSLDAAAEATVFAQVKRLREGRTGIIISHRLSTVRMADRIAVMADGKVAESGTHDELMALSGHYANLFDLQAQQYRSPEQETAG